MSAFAAIKGDGSVITWGDAFCGGLSSAVKDELASDVLQVVGTDNAFAAVKFDGYPANLGNKGDTSAKMNWASGVR